VENILAELLAFSIISVGIIAAGILWRIVSSMVGSDDPAGNIHEAKKEQHEDSKQD
jgi:hypothetical protein